MMKKGFTLLELVVVIIILGVLATLGFTQYGRMVERARGAEARAILGDIRKLAIAYRLANGTITGITAADVNIGTAADQIPGPTDCKSAFYFVYNLSATDPELRVSATRCASGGKPPQYGSSLSTNPFLLLISNLLTGQDTWENNRGGSY